MNRKNFLQLSSMALAAMPFAKAKAVSAPKKPIVISTWNTGIGVNEAAWKVLSAKGSALDAVEAGAVYIEDQVSCCVGLDGYPDRDGIVTLDSCIMDHKANCGAVAALEQIRHPVSVARRVMETTPHVMLAGEGAQQFALENGFPLMPAKLSTDAQEAYDRWLKKSSYQPQINIEKKDVHGPFAPTHLENGDYNHDTMGLLALDEAGDLSGAVTTSGLAFKIHGRVGDSPIIGAGLFVDNSVGAAASTGVGEEAIRICGSHLVVENMRHGDSPEMACKKAIMRIVNRDPERAKEIQVVFMAINKQGEVGAFALQKGFEYALHDGNSNRLVAAKYWHEKK